jgi:nucleosome binding factor SPN SPT16 subunit
MADQIHTNFGFGIGSKYKEEELSITSNNNLKITEGMVFHVRITFKDIARKGPIALADTVHVQSSTETKILTEAVPRKYKHISYTIDEDDDEEDKSDAENENPNTKNGHSSRNENDFAP